MSNDEMMVMADIGNGGVSFCLNMFEVYVDDSGDWRATIVTTTTMCYSCAGVVDLGALKAHDDADVALRRRLPG